MASVTDTPLTMESPGGPSTGVYSVPDAAQYLRATTPPSGKPVRLWRRNRDAFIAPSARHLYRWIRSGLRPEFEHLPRRDLLIRFDDLIRLRMIALLRSRGLSTRAIAESESEARRLTGKADPLVTEPLWAFSSDVFLRITDQLVAASRRGQLGMEFLIDFLQPANHGLSFGSDSRATSWSPADRVLIDPAIQFGAPCIEGTRIQTEVVWEMHRAGDSCEFLATMYGVTLERIRAAVAWEETLARAA